MKKTLIFAAAISAIAAFSFAPAEAMPSISGAAAIHDATPSSAITVQMRSDRMMRHDRMRHHRMMRHERMRRHDSARQRVYRRHDRMMHQSR